ncbi:hypothetical protein [Herbaspirillum robiniae]|uniref:Lipoprotein n=1 Tax=Herbaspirillum robiniae TaxID=2014887 RepID=A0A246WN20_9BURK|nr:hypothetical protein [Herbaspirillum robiniae]OWY27704.1 hypothetical protein CEJ42_18600 [Herbaspirillum robiniae]
MLRFTLMLISLSLLSACALTRVSDGAHRKEVDELDAVGLTLEAARAKAVENGFACDAQVRRNVSVATADGVRRSDTLECDKTSAELMCPQRRYVTFNADAASGKVYAVGARIARHSCF